MDWDAFTNLPSRFSAEAMERAERANFLKEVSENGFSNSYRGIRISSTGETILHRVSKSLEFD